MMKRCLYLIPKDVSETKKIKREYRKRLISLLLLQQDLMVMTVITVFRNLHQETIWQVDQFVKDRFNAKSLHAIAMKEDIP